MKFKKAAMEVVDIDDRPVGAYPRVQLDAKDNRVIDLRTFTGHGRSNGQVAEIRGFVVDTDLASEEGQETGDDHVLLDWFQVHDAAISIYDGRVTIVGYQQGAEGSRRDGHSPVDDGRGNPLDDYDRTLVRVRWDLW